MPNVFRKLSTAAARNWKMVLIGIGVLLIVTAVVQNYHPLPIQLLFLQVQLPLPVFVLFVFLLGAAFGALAGRRYGR